MAKQDEVDGGQGGCIRVRRLHPPSCDGTWKPFQYNRSFLFANPQFGLQTDAHTTIIHLPPSIGSGDYLLSVLCRCRRAGRQGGRWVADRGRESWLAELCKNRGELWEKMRAHIKTGIARCVSPKGLMCRRKSCI